MPLIHLSKDRQQSLDADEQLKRIPEPIFRIEMPIVPSWNDYLALAKRFDMAQGFKMKWHKAGRKAAIQAGWKRLHPMLKWIEHDLTTDGRPKPIEHEKFKRPISIDPVIMVLRVWRPTFAVYDVFNPYTKSIVDGFIEAGLMPDDNCFLIRSQTVEFMGVDERLKPSKDAKEARRIKRLMNKSKRLPVSARYWFDFYPAQVH